MTFCSRTSWALYRRLGGQHRIGHSTGWVWSGGIFWFRVLGFGAYRIRGERWWLLLPGKPPKRNRGVSVTV